MCLFRVPSLALCDCASFSGFIRDGPETPIGENITLRPVQFDASAARPAGCGLTTSVDTTGRFQRGVTTIASSRSSRTAQSGGFAAGSEHTNAYAAGDTAATQSENHTTNGVDTRADQGSGGNTTRSYHHGQPTVDCYRVTGSVPANWGMPHGSLHRHCSTDSPYQQHRGCRHAVHPSHTTP